MGILDRFFDLWTRYRQRQAERKALRLLVARKDRRLLRDAGLNLVDADEPRCEPLLQTKERRWTAPLIPLRPPSPPRRQGTAPSGVPANGWSNAARSSTLADQARFSPPADLPP